jgi:hypothetical protein
MPSDLRAPQRPVRPFVVPGGALGGHAAGVQAGAGYPPMMRLAKQEDSTGGRPLPIGTAASAMRRPRQARAMPPARRRTGKPTPCGPNGRARRPITPTLIQQQYFVRWNGQLPQYILGEGNNGVFLPLLGGLLKSARRALARPAGATERRATWRDVRAHQHVRSHTGTGESHGWKKRKYWRESSAHP